MHTFKQLDKFSPHPGVNLRQWSDFDKGQFDLAGTCCIEKSAF